MLMYGTRVGAQRRILLEKNINRRINRGRKQQTANYGTRSNSNQCHINTPPITHRGIVPIEEGTQEGRRDGPVQIGLRQALVEHGVVRELPTGDVHGPLDRPGIDDGVPPRRQLRRRQRADADSHPNLAGGILCGRHRHGGRRNYLILVVAVAMASEQHLANRRDGPDPPETAHARILFRYSCSSVGFVVPWYE